MVYFIMIHLFDQSGIWIWNRVRGRLNWRLWRVNLNITINNGMMIKYRCDSWNLRTAFVRRGPVFEVWFLRLALPLSWWLSWFFTMKGVEFIHLTSKTWWEKLRANYYACISLVSNTSTSFTNNRMSHAESYNNWLESWCIIGDERWRINMMRELTWSGQCRWG